MEYDRLIIQILERLLVLEEKVNNLEKQTNGEINSQNGNLKNANLTDLHNNKNNVGKDYTKYILDGKIYGKSRLVQAVVRKYLELNSNTTAEELIQIFDKSLQGSFPVVETLDYVKSKYTDYQKRFFTDKKDLITTKTQICTICSQWNYKNIKNILVRAEELGIKIKIIR